MFHDDISLEEFEFKVIPKINFKEEVSTEVIEIFKVIRKLLIHSYYEYKFIDIAVTRALHTFELAMKLRYKEINSGKEWSERAPLNQLLEWFRSRSYFEIENPEFFKHVRDSRNSLTHLRGDHFAGTASLHWINTAVDLINDLYEDIEIRKQRFVLQSKIKSNLDKFVSNGAKFKGPDGHLLLYAAGPLFVNNKTKPFSCYFSFLPIYDWKTEYIKDAIVFALSIDELDVELPEIKMIDQDNTEFLITNELSMAESEEVSKQREVLNQHNPEVILHDRWLYFDAEHKLRSFKSRMRRMK